MSYQIYQIEPLGTAAFSVLIATGFTNPGQYFKAEFFLVIPDDEPFFTSKAFRFRQKAFPPGGTALDESFMLRLAYERGRLALLEFARNAAKKCGYDLYPKQPKILPDDRELLLNYWIAGYSWKPVSEIAALTECVDLQDYIFWISSLPAFDERDHYR